MKTALEWFIEKLEEEQLIFNHGLVERWKQQAKEMEKQQIINAYNISGMRSVLYDEQQGDGEDYYNYLINDISE
jgi:hypothetical protein